MNHQSEFALEQMVSQQIRAGDVFDQDALAVLRSVPRERFVPASWSGLAYADTSVPLPAGQRMLPPLMVGRILQALELSPTDRVLEVGTGSGYLSACMARLCSRVCSLELHEPVAAFARANLAAVAAGTVEVLTTDVFEFTSQAAYDAIVLTGSLPVADDRFQRWLVPGGRVFQIVGTGSSMEANLIRRNSVEKFTTTLLFETSIPALEHARQADPFRF